MLQEVSATQEPETAPPTFKGIAKRHRQVGARVHKIAVLNMRLGKKIAYWSKRTGDKVEMLKNDALYLAKGIYEYATEHRTELLLKGGKGVDLPHGGTIEWQTVEPSLCYDMKEKEAVAILKKIGLGSCIDYTPRVSKDKVKAKLKQQPSLLKKLEKNGFTLQGGEVFRLTFTGQKLRVQGDAKEGILDVMSPRDTKAAEPAST